MWLSCGGQETMESYGGHPDDVPDEHIQFLKDCRRYYETDSHMFVHANYDFRILYIRFVGTHAEYDHVDPEYI